MITDKQKKNRQHKKELNSLRNKMNGSNLIWFDSLTKESQYDLLFKWKKEKYTNTLKKPEISYVKMRVIENGRFKIKSVKVIKYPPSLKHFINKSKNKYQVQVNRKRDVVIDILLNKK